jgi:hypothetical protein
MNSASQSSFVTPDVVEATIEAFTQIDKSGNRRSMNKMARRLGKEQPALLHYAQSLSKEHGEKVGEAAIFYGTLVWAIFDRQLGKCPRLTKDNLDSAEKVYEEEAAKTEGLAGKPVHERTLPVLVDRQPHICAKLTELIEEDVREEAMTEATAGLIIRPTQVILEAFDAAAEGRRPGERLGPVVRETPKVGRNDPCPCGSGNKFKKCCGK